MRVNRALEALTGLFAGEAAGVPCQYGLGGNLCCHGCPLILLVGAAPNAIAYDSKQFTGGEFFPYCCASRATSFMVVCALTCYVTWPLLGMPTTIPKAM